MWFNEAKSSEYFSGGGGIDIGFNQAGYDILFSTDFWKPAVDTLKLNHSARSVKCLDIRQVNYEKELAETGFKVKNVDILVGGPPCPAYSKSRFYRTEKKEHLRMKIHLRCLSILEHWMNYVQRFSF